MKKFKISFIINIIIFILVLLSTIMMLTGFKFMGDELSLTATKIEAFKFFTVDSNILMGITALIFAYYEYLIINNKKELIPNFLYVLKLISTVCVMLTFLVTAIYLAPSVSNYFILYKNSNLFFHLIIPLLSLINLVLFEKTKNIKFKYNLFSLIPIIIYGIFYTINILIHVENNTIDTKYDFYLFAQNGVNSIAFVFLFILLISYIISLMIWFLNKINSK